MRDYVLLLFVGVLHFFTVQHRLEEILEVPKVDMVQKGALHPALRERILAEAVNVHSAVSTQPYLS